MEDLSNVEHLLAADRETSEVSHDDARVETLKTESAKLSRSLESHLEKHRLLSDYLKSIGAEFQNAHHDAIALIGELRARVFIAEQELENIQTKWTALIEQELKKKEQKNA